jgi:hypothetical protein
MPLQILLRRLAGAPIRSERRKFAHDQPFDIRLRRFFILGIRANISNVGISQADCLAGITGIGENFLIASERSIKNNFTATAGACPRRAAFKNSPVLERERGA